MALPPSQGIVLGVPQQELNVAYEGQAPFVNKFYITVTGAVARVAFCELRPDGQPIFRAAVTIGLADLLQLRDLVGQLSQGWHQVPTTGATAPGQSNG